METNWICVIVTFDDGHEIEDKFASIESCNNFFDKYPEYKFGVKKEEK